MIVTVLINSPPKENTLSDIGKEAKDAKADYHFKECHRWHHQLFQGITPPRGDSNSAGQDNP
jgi:hypothetical protein